VISLTNYKNEVAECCKKLKLSSNLAEMAMNTDGETHQEYIYKLFSAELENRAKARIAKLTNTAGFPIFEKFNDFRFDEVKLQSGITIESLKELEFIEEQKNLIFYGGTGTGKTMLSICLGLEAVRRGIPVKFYRAATLINLLSESKQGGTLAALTTRLNKAKVIILDEFGYVPYDKIGSQLLFDFLSEIHQKKIIILTTNLEFSKWVNVLYDEQMAVALVGRLMHHCHLLLFPGENNRLKESSINDAIGSFREEA